MVTSLFYIWRSISHNLDGFRTEWYHLRKIISIWCCEPESRMQPLKTFCAHQSLKHINNIDFSRIFSQIIEAPLDQSCKNKKPFNDFQTISTYLLFIDSIFTWLCRQTSKPNHPHPFLFHRFIFPLLFSFLLPFGPCKRSKTETHRGMSFVLLTHVLIYSNTYVHIFFWYFLSDALLLFYVILSF